MEEKEARAADEKKEERKKKKGYSTHSFSTFTNNEFYFYLSSTFDSKCVEKGKGDIVEKRPLICLFVLGTFLKILVSI